MTTRFAQKTLVLLVCLYSGWTQAEIAPEAMGVIKTLPATYPEHWVIVHDGAFFHMSEGKFVVMDADSDDQWGRYKGMFNGANISSFYQATTRSEMYIAETYYSRGNRGERTDVLTVYDNTTLEPIAEIVIPAKRSANMPTAYNFQVVDNEKIGLIYNFTPAASITVVDLVERTALGEISIPGCALVYPMGGRAFASMCSDGSMLSVQLDEAGQKKSSHRTEPFFNVDEDPLMEKAVMINGTAYFPTFKGDLVPIDLRGDKPVVGEPWSLVGDSGWRPGGIWLGNSDANSRLYLLMHPNGVDGGHKDPGTEVWVFDVESKKRISKIALKLPGLSIGMTRDKSPLLIVTNVNMELDVYEAESGKHLRTIGGFGQETPFVVYGAR